MRALPRTRTSRVPSRASSKQCRGSQCEVKIVTLWPRFWRPTAASIMRRSAPPMPRSGWKKIMFLGLGGVLVAIVEGRGVDVCCESLGQISRDANQVAALHGLRKAGGM